MGEPFRIDASYPLAELYAETVLRVRELAPEGLDEVWGVVQFKGHDDYRLKLGRYRVIGLAPLATRIAVWMDWPRLFALAEAAPGDADAIDFVRAFPQLQIRNRQQPWNVTSLEECSSTAATLMLRSGMRLMVRQLRERFSQ